MKYIKKALIRYRQSIITAVVILLISSVGFFFTRSYHQSAPDQLKKITASVGKLIILPTNETPTLATITDTTKLKNTYLFNGAENGDRVLVYTKAQQIIIYRPSINKIVNVRPFVADKTGSPYVTAKIAILNGSGNDDLLNKMTRVVVSAFPNSTIVQKDSAPRLFPNSIVIDLTKNNQPLDEQIADTLGIKAGQLPLGINVVDAGFLIIVGQDYH